MELVNVMKNVIYYLTMMLFISILNSCGSYYSDGHDYSTCYAVNGIWTDWQGMDLKFAKLYGNYSNIQIVSNEKPWIIICRFYTNRSINMNATKEWESYSGYIEYYVSDQYPTIQSQFKRQRYKYNIHDFNDVLAYLPFGVTSVSTGAVKRTATATIRIAPHKKNKPQTYSIFFDGVSFGLDLRNLKWEGL